MKRLTYRTDNGEYTGMPNSIEIRTALEKLSKIEDIEEELGIDLITLFKALKDGINVYYEDEERYKFHNDLRIEYHKTLGWGLVYIYMEAVVEMIRQWC